MNSPAGLDVKRHFRIARERVEVVVCFELSSRPLYLRFWSGSFHSPVSTIMKVVEVREIKVM